jgi:hypothetical protein
VIPALTPPDTAKIAPAARSRYAHGMRNLILLLCVALGSSCLYTTRKEAFDEALREYNTGLRWGRTDWMAEHVSKDKQDSLVRGQVASGTLQITNCELESLKMDGDARAVAVIRVEWYRLDQARLFTSTLRQTWKRDGRRWEVTELRQSGGAPYPPMSRRSSPI